MDRQDGEPIGVSSVTGTVKHQFPVCTTLLQRTVRYGKRGGLALYDLGNVLLNVVNW